MWLPELELDWVERFLKIPSSHPTEVCDIRCMLVLDTPFFMHLIKCKINETWTLIIAVNRSSKFLYWIQHYSITLTCIFSLWFNIWLVSWGQLVSLTFSSLRWGEVEDQRSVDSISLSRVGKSKIQNFLQFKSIDLISFKCNSYGRFQPFYKMLNLHFCVLVFWLVAWLNTACCC